MGAILAVSVVLVAIALYYLFKPRNKYAKGIKLEKKFDSIGSMKGMKKQEVISKVGEPPYSTTDIFSGQLLQWHEVGFNIAIFFHAHGTFSSITHKEINRGQNQSKVD